MNALGFDFAEKFPVKIALAADGDMFLPSLVAIRSVAENTSRQMVLHFIGQGISESQHWKLTRLCEDFSIQLEFHELSDDIFSDATQKDRNISLVTLARLLLPGLVAGRVLYLDSDILVRADIAELYDSPMGDAKIAAARDFRVLQLYCDADGDSEKLRSHREVMGGRPVTDYFNAGVLLMDCDAIRRDDGLSERMVDFEAASGFPLLDQDFLNFLFKGSVKLIGGEWNEIWGRTRYRRKVLKGSYFDPVRDSEAKIIHFTGPNKPWKPHRVSTLMSGKVWAALAYRRALKSLQRQETGWSVG